MNTEIVDDAPQRKVLSVTLPDGSHRRFYGRDAWALKHLLKAASVGVTTIDHPAPRWSHYIYKLRKAGLSISTEHEPHAGDFPGTHGRYRLETSVRIEGNAA
jgi:hypothetical protein